MRDIGRGPISILRRHEELRGVDMLRPGPIQAVVLDELLCLKFSCCRFESIGLPCVHQAAVIKDCFPNWIIFPS